VLEPIEWRSLRIRRAGKFLESGWLAHVSK
jgi:hypothetical protein